MPGGLRRQLLERLDEPTLRRIQRVRHGESVHLDRPVRRGTHGRVTPAVVEAFDAHAVRAEVVAAVRDALDGAGVAYVLLPGPRRTVRQVAVDATDRDRAIAALQQLTAADGWVLTGAKRARVVTAYRVLAAPGGQLLCGTDTACEVAFWTTVTRADVPRADGDPHTPGTRLAPGRNGVVAYLTESSWQCATRAPNHWVVAEPAPDVFEVREPIDLVYTWVDGNDPAWQERKARYAPQGESHNVSAARLARFVNRDELRYSMRSAATFASWIRTIYLVTDGQVPEWLDPSHPKVRVVDHREIFRDPAVLPVFNSHAIESQLHHIDGLAEHYLYANDDTFFGRPLEPELFFHGNGIAKFFVSPETIDADPPSVRDLPVMTAAKNGRALMAAEFGVTVRRKFQHAAHPQLRSVLAEMERRHQVLFDQVAASRFRHPDDVSIPSALHHYYAYARGRAVPGEWDYHYQDISQPNTPRRLDALLRARPQVYCLNDIDSQEHQLAEQESALAQFFGEYYPLPAPWEKGARQ